MTKLFAATAVMRLADRGRVDLDAPAESYLPWLSHYKREVGDITIRQLLSHSSGLPDNVPAVIGWTHGADKAEQNQTEFLPSVFDGYSTLKYTPGSEHRYTGEDELPASG
jgi:CubicO group peptidase (beta-lactamase class C family)